MEIKRLLVLASSLAMKNEFKTRITWIKGSSTSLEIFFVCYILFGVDIKFFNIFRFFLVWALVFLSVVKFRVLFAEKLEIAHDSLLRARRSF